MRMCPTIRPKGFPHTGFSPDPMTMCSAGGSSEALDVGSSHRREIRPIDRSQCGLSRPLGRARRVAGRTRCGLRTYSRLWSGVRPGTIAGMSEWAAHP